MIKQKDIRTAGQRDNGTARQRDIIDQQRDSSTGEQNGRRRAPDGHARCLTHPTDALTADTEWSQPPPPVPPPPPGCRHILLRWNRRGQARHGAEEWGRLTRAPGRVTSIVLGDFYCLPAVRRGRYPAELWPNGRSSRHLSLQCDTIERRVIERLCM